MAIVALVLAANVAAQSEIRIGIIGLDTSHSTAFTQLINGGYEEFALYDNATFIKLYEEMYPEYKWRKNSTIAKLYQQSIAGELKEIKKEVFFEDENLTAFTEGDRVYIKFLMRPKRQLIVALKSRGWWWNSHKEAWSTCPNKLDKEWVASISEKYVQYI